MSTQGQPKKGPNFSTVEITTLLHIWGSPEFQQKFSSGGRRHTKIWLEISQELYLQGQDDEGTFRFVQRTAVDIKNKVNNEKKKYTKQVNALKSGEIIITIRNYYKKFVSLFIYIQCIINL
jgi:hypothetical protein